MEEKRLIDLEEDNGVEDCVPIINSEEEYEDDYSTTLTEVVVDSREDAEKIIGACCIVAISYRGDAEDTEEIRTLRGKLTEAKERVRKYVEEHSVKTFVAKNIGCRKCGSSLAKEFLQSDICPLCGNDLRSQSTIEAEMALRQKADALEKELNEKVRVNRFLNGKVETLKFNED